MIRINKKKFIRAVLLIGVLVFLIVLFFSNKSFSHKDIITKNISVVNGDTLWSIAKVEQKENDYYEGRDIRYIIQDIKEINNLTSSNLKVNQVLEIPTF